MSARPDRVAAPRTLPRGRNPAPREVVLLSQRSRLLEAIGEVVATKGYPATTVADVVRAAGVSRATFYEQFKDKEDCFLAAYRDGAKATFAAIADAVDGLDDPMERLRFGLRAYLKTLEASPARTRMALVDVVAAGDAALAERARVHERYVRMFAAEHAALRKVRRGPPALPALTADVLAAMVAGGNELVVRALLEGRSIRDVEPQVWYLQLALLGLGDEAAAVLRKARRKG